MSTKARLQRLENARAVGYGPRDPRVADPERLHGILRGLNDDVLDAIGRHFASIRASDYSGNDVAEREATARGLAGGAWIDFVVESTAAKNKAAAAEAKQNLYRTVGDKREADALLKDIHDAIVTAPNTDKIYKITPGQTAGIARPNG